MYYYQVLANTSYFYINIKRSAALSLGARGRTCNAAWLAVVISGMGRMPVLATWIAGTGCPGRTGITAPAIVFMVYYSTSIVIIHLGNTLRTKV